MRRWLVVMLALIAALLPLMAHAQTPPDPPDTLQLIAVNGFRNVAQSGDLLIFSHYNIAYDTLPDYSAQQAFIFRLRKSDTTTIGIIAPYPFNDQGYGQGVTGIYLTPAQVTDASLGAYPYADLTFRLEGNPTIFTSVPSTDWVLTSGDYYDADSTQAGNQAALCLQIKAAASSLQSAWQVTILNDSNLLNATGSSYLELAIPGSRLMAPSCFSTTTNPIVVPTPVGTPGGPGTFAGDSKDRFDDIPWLSTAFDDLADDLNMPKGSIQGFLIAALIAACSIGGGVASSKTGGGGSAGAAAGLGMAAIVLLPLGLFTGFLDASVGGLIVALIVLLAGGKWILDRF